jgi:hypothetical protein
MTLWWLAELISSDNCHYTNIFVNIFMIILISRNVVYIPQTVGSLELYYVVTNLALSQIFIASPEDNFFGSASGDIMLKYSSKFVSFPYKWLFLQCLSVFDLIYLLRRLEYWHRRSTLIFLSRIIDRQELFLKRAKLNFSSYAEISVIRWLGVWSFFVSSNGCST